MAIRSISVEIYTTSHRVLGRANPGATGLLSYLNIPTKSFLEIEGAHVMRLHQPNRMVARHPNLWIVKNEIVTILLSSRAELGPTTYVRGGFSSTVPNWVRIIMGGYEIVGIVETPGKFRFEMIMFEGDSIFIPLYNGELSAILFPTVKADSAAMAFNRNMVDALGLLGKDEIPVKPKESS
jgi:hypothetical protein